MFDVTVDAWYAWIGLSLAGVALFGATAGLPSAPPPDAGAVGATVDRVAATEYASTAEHPLDADSIRLGTRRIALRSDAGTAHVSLAFGPVTPVPVADSPLRDVLHGMPPERVYDSPEAFRQAVVDARARATDAPWREVDRTLLVRRTAWEDVAVVLVDA
ncbi:DUF7283 family protein [Halobellus clavatus]|jgi:hypothetical protein|uniref:Uncharacterized protein n=1 Tax=Halobellus clavatus TaxID=660517 RepID=A0A1H3CPS5_9EURY|nr:hypothetical protein [Halobellus clavatus]SDX55429.1 hypothetical protein SAMN04487946_101101 [Halobellus clavatus]